MRLLRILRFRQKNVMKFEKITQENIDLLKPYLYACPHQMCGYSPLVLTMWSDYFDYRYALCQDTLFLKMRDESGAQYFFMPICDVENGLELLREHCRETGDKLQFFGVGEEYVELFCKRLNAKNPVELEKWADYLYDARALTELVGKKYNAKRNHINKFRKTYPQAEFKDFKKAYREKVLAFLEKYSKNDLTASYFYDKNEVSLLVENWRDGEYPAGYMEIDGEAVGFTVGDIVGDTLFVHVEKCLRDISGVYEATTNAFLKRHVTDAVKFVNREEDMGIEGLRKSKMSYYPLRLVKKYRIIEND